MDSDSNFNKIMRLFPSPVESLTLRGLYLDESLRPEGTPENPLVYASFIASMDGRISLPDPESGTQKVPRATANPRDWRLFQELAASADVVVTSGRYIRDLSAGAAQSGLPVIDKPEFADLLEWRKIQGLSPQPAVVIVSNTLNLPIPDGLLQSERPIYIAIGADVDRSPLETLKLQGVHVLQAGKGLRVEGKALIKALAEEGFGTIDMIAGSEMLNTLLVDNALDRLYLTKSCQILGGSSFNTLLKGPQLEPPAEFELRSLFYDSGDRNTPDQLFSVFNFTK